MSDAVQPSHATRVRELFEADVIAAGLGLELVAVGAGSVRLRFTVDERHVGWHGRCHGGVLFTAADVAMSYVSNRGEAQAFATHASIEFLGGVGIGDVVDIEGGETARRGRTAVLDAMLSVDGKIVAGFRGTTLEMRG